MSHTEVKRDQGRKNKTDSQTTLASIKQLYGFLKLSRLLTREQMRDQLNALARGRTETCPIFLASSETGGRCSD